ncbi:MAG TPA: holo-ACP synthase [Longimicrobiales bacterium]|nr:holo-ACP synthase [Longimicrobiales bacterium]
MVLGTGLDLVSIDRFKRFTERRGERALQRLFTHAELTYCFSHADPTQSLAARFAAKEAFFKALGTGMGPAGGWRDVEVIRLASGRPRLLLHGRAAASAQELHVRTIHLSLTHTADTAGALVILEA